MAFSKEEREINKILLIATLNYLLEYHSQDMVFDDFSPSKQWYLQELKQAELDIKNSRSQRIKRRLDLHTAILRSKFDQGYNKYIKENTSYEVNLFEQFKADVLPIIKKGSINHNDVYLVEYYMKAYSTNPNEQDNIAILKNLQAKREAYLNDLCKNNEVITESYHLIIQGKKSWTVADEDYEQFYKENSKDWLLEEVIAPNGIDKLLIQHSGKGEHALTYIIIELKGGSGSIYGALGEKLPLKTYWRNDNTVVVETKSDYEILNKYNQVSSYGDIVKIEYVEH
ncbi:MAG: hypothetical protein V4546_09440 [Bacteroidota bacterium]